MAEETVNQTVSKHARQEYKRKYALARQRQGGQPMVDVNTADVFECGKRLMSMRATAAKLGCAANTIANRFRADWEKGRSLTLGKAAGNIAESVYKGNLEMSLKMLRQFEEDWKDKPVETITPQPLHRWLV